MMRNCLATHPRRAVGHRGIDGRLYFHDDATLASATKEILIRVKGGGVNVTHGGQKGE